jgi:glycosyl transferase family 25
VSGLRAFIVHVAAATDRRRHMEDQMARAGIRDVEWVPAVDWRSANYLPRNGLATVRDDVLIEHNWDGRKYLRGEDAIFQSHLKALQALLDSGVAFGLIFEDDAELAPGFLEIVEQAIGHALRWDMVCLEGYRPWGGRPAIRIAALGDATLVASLNPCAGSAAYLVTREGARELVAHAGEVLEPVDNYLNALWRHRLRVLDVSPFPARQGSLVSIRNASRPPHRRSPYAAFTDWQRHIRADFVGRYLRRWAMQLSRYGAGGLTIARWSRPSWP